ncbi:hypothetical protein I4F81_005210 [Pyropia yezoensis]|uniref:Uncharacterized protein n=1 Tax=Pyropia yezoensis TaxID=2788 RepID=A0ACC3BXL5_PYRYE|nr:hypothetical protein I4F81_005210 [Neopyropia yezoensis]
MSYLPYNLSSVSPLASTTAALHLLPVLQPLQPSLGETPAVEETAPAGASAATPAADVADIASLLQAAQDETGGSLDDDHCPSVMELDWNSAALLAQLKSVRPGLFVPPPVTGTAQSGLGDEERGAQGIASPTVTGAAAHLSVGGKERAAQGVAYSLRQSSASPPQGRQPNPIAPSAVRPPSFASAPVPPERSSATLVRSSPPHAVRMRTTLRTVPKEVSVSDSTALKRALKSFVEISCDNLSSWHVVELRRATVSDAGARALPTVPEPLILDVARRLQLRIVASIVPLDVASPLTAACTSAAVDAMECALVLVTLMMTPGSVAVLRVEETCEAVIDLLRLVLRRVVFPARDPSFEPLPLAPVSRRQSSKPSMGGGSDTCSEDGSEEEDAAAHLDDEVLDDQPSRRTARGPRRRRASRNNAHVRPPDALFSLCCRVVRDWGEALESHDGPDEFGGAQASRLALVLLRSLSVSGVTELQLCACSTICVVFRYYEASRHDLLTELLHKVNRLPVGRSDLRRFRVGGPGVQPSMVRVSSALFLQLVHILGGLAEEELCPVAETAATRLACAQPGSADSRGSLPHIAYLQAVVRMQGAVRAFVDALVAPAFQARDVSVRDAKFLDGKGRDGDVVDAVTVFVEDILALYGLPEWPGADTVVQLLFLSLSKFQQQSSSAEGGSSRGADAHTRASVFAWLGALAARLQAEAVAEAEWRGTAPAVAGDGVATGACGGERGLRENRNVLCRAAVLEACQPPARGGLRLRSSALYWRTQWVVDDSRTAMKHSSNTCGSFPALPGAVGGPSDPEALPTAQGMVQPANLDGAGVASIVGDVSAAAASRWLTRRRAVEVRLLDRVLDAIMVGFSESVPTVRTQALKAMSLVASVDPLAVQARANFVTAIRSCCMDVSVLVRDAALSLLCNVFSTLDSLDAAVCATGGTIQHWQDVSAPVVRRFDATFVTNVLPVVSGRLLDLATSVRKRAVGILSQVVADAFLVLLSARRTTALFENDNRLGDTEQLVVDVCALLVTRLADAEDSVRFASQCALRAVLFGYASEKGPRGFRATGRRDGPFAALLAPSDLVVERTRASILVGIVAKAPASTCIRSLVEVLHVSLLATERPALSRLLSLVVAELLAADLGTIESSPERARARADALQRVDASATTDQGCINLAAVGGETTANGTVSVAVARLALSPDVESAAQRRIACSQIVSAFATVDADLVFPFCSLLAPLLKGLDGAPRYQVMVASHVLDTIERVIPVVRPTPSELVGELEEDLSLVICTHRDEQLAAAAIKCICAISPVACAVDRSVNVVGSTSTTGEVVSSVPSGSSPAASSSGRADAVGSVRSTKRVRFWSASPVEAVPETLARQFYQYLYDNQCAVQDGNPSFHVNAGVALVRLGLFCRYAAFDTATTTAYYTVLESFASASSRDWTERHPLREAALEGLAHVVIRRRDLLLSAVPFFAAPLRQPGLVHGHADMKAQLRVLDDLHDMLLSEDFRAQPSLLAVAGRKHHSGKTGVTAPAASAAAGGALAMEDDPDAGSLTAAVQSLQLDLVNLAVNADAQIRHRVAAILDLTVRHGVLLASALVSPLVGLTADRADVRTGVAALRALEFISSRHSYLLTSRFVDGVLSAFLVASQCARSPISSPLTGASSVSSHTGEPPAVCPLALAVDPLTGYSRLSSAVALLAVSRRKVVFESLLKAIHAHSKETEPGASVTRRALSSGGVRASAMRRSSSGLAFIASTMCSIDFGCVSSAGTPSSEKSPGAGTGSSAADAKAKSGRDEIAFIVTTAGRLVSSTGHSLFSAATVTLQAASYDVTELQSLAVRSVPLCYLLLVKRHFVAGLRDGGFARGPGTLSGTKCPSTGAQQFESPLYNMDTALLSAGADAATWRQQLRVFCHLMDTDEAIEAAPGRSPGGARGRRPRRAT